MREGCDEAQDAVGLMHCTASVLDGAYANLEAKEKDALSARLARAQAYAQAQSLDTQASTLLSKISRSLRNALSSRFSAAWQETGWPGNSVAVPATQDARMILLGQLQTWYSQHADLEVPKQGITAQACGQLHDSLVQARARVTACEADANKKQADLEAAEELMRQKMRDLIVELSRLLSGSDPRWLRFGLNLPDAPEVPDAPENVAVNNRIPGKLLVTCDPVPGAAHYRFWKQEGEAEPVVVGSAQEPQFFLEGLAPGVAVKVYVSAVNAEGGESQRSAPAEGTPVAAAA
jgi:hypothetical protein